MKIHYFQQRSEMWEQIRIGKFTGTDFQTVANGTTKGKESLAWKKAAEKITGCKSYKKINSRDIERGVLFEDEARIGFQLETGLEVQQVGFIELDDYSGVSPDGLIGEDEGIEIKCKDYHTHLEQIIKGKIESSYMWQIQGNLYVSGRKKWYFVSYNPDFPIGKELWIKEVFRDEEKIEKIKAGLEEMKGRVETIISNYRGLK